MRNDGAYFERKVIMSKKIRSLISGVLCAAMTVSAFTSVSVTEVSAETLLLKNQLEKATSQQILADMGMGWNLGNTLDATGKSKLSTETSWGNPKATQELIDTVKSLGFNTVRIPVTWYKHVDDNYTIDTKWLDRVQEVVDYCYNDGLYVILNTHHDCRQELTGSIKGYTPSSTYYTKSEQFIDSVWTQVAERFKDYDYHLIFETMNEPRLIGSSYEWWFNKNSVPSKVKDSIDCINKLNQSAVDVIRASGSRNAGRLIMCPGYDASVDGATVSGFRLPTDISGNSNRIVLSVHGYSPYDFAMGTAASTYGDEQKQQLRDWTMTPIKTNYIDKGIPVVMGEFSSTASKSLSERLKWATDYAGLASAMNMPIVLWDNNAYENSDASERHGYIDRSTNQLYENQGQVLNDLFAPYKALEAQRLAAATSTITVSCTVSGEDAVAKAGTINVSVIAEDNSDLGTFEVNNGKAAITGRFDDSNHTLYFNAKHCAEKGIVVTINNGQPTEAVSEKLNLIGDVDGDGKLTSADLLLTKSHIKGVAPLTGYELSCADVDGNGEIKAGDLLAMKSHIKAVTPLW